LGIGEVRESRGGWNQVGEIDMRFRDIGVTKEPERRVDMSLEMLDVHSMDTGRYRAMVIQDPRDKHAIKGFFHLARVYPQSSLRTGQLSGASGAGNRTLYNLADFLNTYTGIHADFLDQVTFDDERLMEVPFIIYTGGTLNEAELRHLTHYLLRGGFIFGIGGRGEGAWGVVSSGQSSSSVVMEGLQKYGGLISGSDFYVARVPDDHPIYSIFFSIGGKGTPLTTAGGHHDRKTEEWNYMVGIWVKGRLATLDFGFQGGAGAGIWGQGSQLGVDTVRHMQFAANVIIYALTQEGSITHQLMQTVK
jgi:hypothetical protein